MKYDWLFVLVTSRGNRCRVLRARVNLYVYKNKWKSLLSRFRF